MNDEKIKQEIANAWNQESNFYDSHVSHGMKSDEEKKLWMEAFSTRVKNDTQLQVLDVGCGTGAMGLIFAEMGHTVEGIDLSEGMMDVGRKKAADMHLAMNFSSGDAEHPPFDDRKFDVIVNRHLLWTLPNPDTAISSWFRVLKPNGTLLVIDGVWDDGSRLNTVKKKISHKIASLVEAHPHGGKSRYSEEVSSYLPNKGGTSEEKAKEYFENAGFTNITVVNLDAITDEQRKYFSWYMKIAPKSTYYLISGKKPEST